MNPLFSKDSEGRTIRDLIQGTINQIHEEEIREIIFLSEPYYEIEGAMAQIDATSASLGKHRGLSILRQLFSRLLNQMDVEFKKHETKSAKAASAGVFKLSDYSATQHLPSGPEGLENYIEEVMQEWREIINNNEQWAIMTEEAEKLLPSINIELYWQAVIEVDIIAENLAPKVLEETIMNERFLDSENITERLIKQQREQQPDKPEKASYGEHNIAGKIGPGGYRLK